jgi:hypothetical protein
MKKILNLPLMLLFFLIPCFFSMADQPPGPKIAIDEISYNFKEVNEGNTIEHSFTVFNKGEKPLSIEKVETG